MIQRFNHHPYTPGNSSYYVIATAAETVYLMEPDTPPAPSLVWDGKYQLINAMAKNPERWFECDQNGQPLNDWRREADAAREAAHVMGLLDFAVDLVKKLDARTGRYSGM